MTIAALYVEAGGAYAHMSDVECWTEASTQRSLLGGDVRADAREYAGPHSVIAHPPCSTWCQMAKVNEARYGHEVGSDGGCFKAALAAVRTWGGVLEHPAYSHAWPAFGLQRPERGKWTPCDEEGVPFKTYVTELSQSAYGHKARKRTWLYYVGDVPPPDLDWRDLDGSAWCGWNMPDKAKAKEPKPTLSKREAKATPPAFKNLLVQLPQREGLHAAECVLTLREEVPMTSAKFVLGSESSQAGAEAIEPHVGTMREDVMFYLRTCGARTKWQASHALGVRDTTLGAIIRGLCEDGLVVKLTRKAEEKGPRGGDACLFMVAELCAEPHEEYKPHRSHSAVSFEGYAPIANSAQADVAQMFKEGGVEGYTDEEGLAWLTPNGEWTSDMMTHYTMTRGSLVRTGHVWPKMDYSTPTPTPVKRRSSAGVLCQVWVHTDCVTAQSKQAILNQPATPRVRGYSANAKAPRAYDPTQRYAVGDKVSHAEHGVGFVEFVDVDGSQIEVAFQGGVRELAACQPESVAA